MDNNINTFQLKCTFIDNLIGTEKSRMGQEYKRLNVDEKGKKK